MKVLKISLLAAAIVTGAAVSAQAADMGSTDQSATGFYVRGDAGWSFLDWTGGNNDSAPAIGAGLGYRFNDNLRADLRADWSGNYSVAPGSDMNISSVLGNMYFDWPTGTAFTPYVGAGVGYGYADIKNAPNLDGMTYGLMAGVGIDVTQNVAIDVGYRFREILTNGPDPFTNEVTAGVRFSF
jgi:opacity protein-like surface antigen